MRPIKTRLVKLEGKHAPKVTQLILTPVQTGYIDNGGRHYGEEDVRQRGLTANILIIDEAIV